MPYAYITPNGYIRLIAPKLDPFTRVQAGEKLAKYDPPAVDSELYTTTPVQPVTGDQVEFTVSQVPNFIEILQKKRTQQVQQHLDREAQKKGYDSILSAVSYGVDTTSPFYQEAISFAAWRSAVWASCFTILNQVLENNLEIPSEAELIAMLPTLEEFYGQSTNTLQ